MPPPTNRNIDAIMASVRAPQQQPQPPKDPNPNTWSLDDLMSSVRSIAAPPAPNKNEWTEQDILKDAAGIISPLPRPGTFAASLRSGLENTHAGYEATFGSVGEGRKIAKAGAALSPSLPDITTEPLKAIAALPGAIPQVLAQSAPQIAATMVGAGTGLAAVAPFAPLAGPFAPVVAGAGAIGGAVLANLPYYYGTNLIEQANALNTDDESKLAKGRALGFATIQSAADSLMTLLMPAMRLGPGQALTTLGRMGKGALFGVIEEASAEVLQEAASILNLHPELKKLLDTESLKKITNAAFYGGAAGAPMGVAGQFVGATPSLDLSPPTVKARVEASRYFTPAAMRPSKDSVIVWTDAEDIRGATSIPRNKDVNQGRTTFFDALPEIELADDGAGGAVVKSMTGQDAVAYLSATTADQVPVRLKMPEGMTRPLSITWGDKTIPLDGEVKARGKGTKSDPVIASNQSDIERARAVTNRGRTPGYIKAWDIDMSVDVPKGQVRKGEAEDGTKWATVAPADYGSVRRTEGADGEELDVWIGPNLKATEAFIIEQQNPETKQFDEHKAMIGFANAQEAIEAYDASFSDGSGPSRRMAVQPMPMHKFKAWSKSGDLKSQVSSDPDAAPVTVEEIQELAESGQNVINWDNDPAFMQFTEKMFKKRHLDELREPELRQLREVMRTIKTGKSNASSLTNPLMVSIESRPTSKLVHMQPTSPEQDAAQDAAAEMVRHHKIENTFIKDGVDVLARALGLDKLANIVGSGQWGSAVNPVTQQELIAEEPYFYERTIKQKYADGETHDLRVKALRPEVRQSLSAYAAARGMVTKQDAVGWHMSVQVAGPSDANGIEVYLGDSISAKDQKGLMAALKAAKLDTDVVPIPTPNGIRLFRDVTITDDSVDHDPNWASAAEKVVQKTLKKKKPTTSYNWTESGLIEQDWSSRPGEVKRPMDGGVFGWQVNIKGGNYEKTFGAAASTEARDVLGRILQAVDSIEITEAEQRGLRYDREVFEALHKAVTGRDPGSTEALIPTPTQVPLAGLEPGLGSQKRIYGAFGSVDPGNDTTVELKIYDLKKLLDRPWLIDRLLDKYGYRVKYFSFEENPDKGVAWRPPDLKRDGYKNGTLWLYNPKNDAGSFVDPPYTNAWRVVHELGHALAEKFVEEKYGPSQREGRLGQLGKSYRGAPGKQVEIDVRGLTPKEAQRAVEWEDLAFRFQRELFKEMGIEISDKSFAREYNVNIADAVYRASTGEFGDPGKLGFVPSNAIPDLRVTLAMLDNAEGDIAAWYGRPRLKGVDLKRWRQVRDNQIKAEIARAAKNRNRGRSTENEDIGIVPNWRNEVTEIMPRMFSPLGRAISDPKLVSRGKGTPAEWKSELLSPGRQQKLGLKKAELEWTGFEDWLDSQPSDKILVKDDILNFLADTRPDVQEIYFGAHPPPVKQGAGQEVATVDQEVEAEPVETPFSEADERSEDGRDAPTPSQIESHVDAMLVEESDYQFREMVSDAERLRGYAEDAADADDGVNYLEDIDPEALDDHDFAAVEEAKDLGVLSGIVSAVGLSLDDFIKQQELPGLELSAAEKLARAKTMANEMLRRALKDWPRDQRGGLKDDDAWKEIAKDEDIRDMVENGADATGHGRLMKAFDEAESQGIRDRLAEEAEQSDEIGNRYWETTVGNFEYKIIEDDSASRSERFRLLIDGREEDSFRSFQAARDAAQGHATAQAAGDVDEDADGGAAATVGQDTDRKKLTHGGAPRWKAYAGSTGETMAPFGPRKYRELLVTVKNMDKEYGHGHFSGVKNPVTHVRAQDLTINGRIALFLKEHQSDQYSSGLKQGFYDPDFVPDDEFDKTGERLTEIRKEISALHTESARNLLTTDPALADVIRQIKKVKGLGKVSDAEFIEAMVPNVDARPAELFSALSPTNTLSGRGEVRAYLRVAIPNAIRKLRPSFDKTKVNEDHLEGVDWLRAVDSLEERMMSDQDSIQRRNQQISPLISEQVSLLTKRNKIIKENDQSKKVPVSPWQKGWQEMVLKRMLIFSAERGYDMLTWPTGNMQSVIEGWGTGERVVNQQPEKAAIRDRNDYSAVNFLGQLGKKYGVKPQLFDKREPGKPVNAKLTMVSFDPLSDKMVDEAGNPVDSLPGDAKAIKRKMANEWLRKQGVDPNNDEEVLKFSKGVGYTGAHAVKNTIPDDMPIRLYEDFLFKADADGKKIEPGKSQLWTVNGISVNKLGDDMFWRFDITDEMRADIMKNGLSGYWRGGLVRPRAA